METHRLYPSFLTESNTTESHGNILWKKYLNFVESQSEYSLAWWMCSLLLQGVLLPLTFLFVYMWNGPVLSFLAISMVCFFTNVIANMGGASFRFRFNSFVLSVIIHAMMIIITAILALQ
jgi:hypothetical protein